MSRFKALAGVVAGIALVTGAGAAQARVLPAGGVTADEVAAALREGGFKAVVGKDDSGDPMVTSALDGSDFKVLFYACKAARCASIQFVAGYDLDKGTSLSKVNMWNREYRFGRAWLDDDMDPYLQYDVDFEIGATTEAISNVIARWETLVPDFKKYVDF